jgi:hypothetical protein
MNMARGFESKSVEFQQEEMARGRVSSGPAMTEDERAFEQRRRTLELSRKRAVEDLNLATAPAHRRMLEQAIAALDAQMHGLSTHR